MSYQMPAEGGTNQTQPHQKKHVIEISHRYNIGTIWYYLKSKISSQICPALCRGPRPNIEFMVRSLEVFQYPKTEDESKCLQKTPGGSALLFFPWLAARARTLENELWRAEGAEFRNFGGLLWICQRPCGSRGLGTTLLRFTLW